ncbi:peritrophin-1 [Drosophila bipectinata]|uniref:peritrophin-1 n=1 Tax=Drosophila bipectinata TaxID=42026 RepID=UPI001C89933F|nr:peritrophin-1 [Drosophila bipectinata]
MANRKHLSISSKSNAVIEAGGQCPAYNDPAHPILLPDPTDCRNYFTCYFGQLQKRQCPSNLYWSETRYRCDLKQYSNCVEEEYNPQVEYRPFPGDCSRFYVTQVQLCPDNLHFSPTYGRCVDHRYAGCEALPWDPSQQGNGYIPSGHIPNTDYLPIDPPDLCNNVASNAYIPYPGDCQKFIHCGPRATVLLCPGDLFWNPLKSSCGVDKTYC